MRMNSSGMTRLISDLLSFARLDNVTRNPREVSCTDAIVWIRMSLQKSLEESGATLTHDALPVVIFDQNQLVQVFQYLITNSVQYRSTEPLKIHISATRQGNEWVLAVVDNGIGFENRYADQIFGAFKRLHGRDFPGTGLGLAFCRRILEYHGGRIWAESEPGKGSTFYFSARGAEAAASAKSL